LPFLATIKHLLPPSVNTKCKKNVKKGECWQKNKDLRLEQLFKAKKGLFWIKNDIKIKNRHMRRACGG